jgi:hypothetical protein
MVFHKPCLGRGMIQHGAESDARRGWAALLKALQQHAAAAGAPIPALAAPPQAPDAQGGGGAAGALSAEARASAGGAPLREARPSWLLSLLGRAPAPPAAGAGLLFAVLLALLTLAAAVFHAGASVSAELRELTAAVREASAVARAGASP